MRESQADSVINYLLMSRRLVVTVRTVFSVCNLTSPYTFGSGFTASIGVGPETSHMVAHTVIASSPSYEVFCVCARICWCACMCTLAASLFNSSIALSSSVRGLQGLAL